MIKQKQFTTTATLLQNNETLANLVSQANPVGVEHFSYVNTFLCSNEFVCLLDVSKNILFNSFCQVSSAATTSLHVIMGNVSKRTCYVMAILLVKMVQMKKTVNALLACSTVRREDVFWQHLCVME